MFKNIENLKAPDVERHTVEYQVLSDAEIIGGIDYGPYLLRPWEFNEKKGPGDERWLLLRVTEKAFSADENPWQHATPKGDYHGGGIPSELTALGSLFLRRRVRLGAMVRLDDSPLYVSGFPGHVDEGLVAGRSNFGDLNEWFELVKQLKSDLQLPFILAAKFYQQAIDLIEEKPDLAYLSLVSAIEVLSQDFAVPLPTLAEINERLARMVGRIGEDDLRNEITEQIIEREFLTSRRFVAFIVAHTGDEFWRAEGRPEQGRGRVEPAQLPELMRRIYNQRSRTLHRGEPFPPNIFHPPGIASEMPLGLGMVIGERRWDPEDFIPHTSFFERLVNHVLKNFLRRNLEREAD